MEMFKYLRRTLDQTENIMHARSVWERLGTLLQQEGLEPRVLAMFYRVEAQTILLYGLETWVLLVAMEKNIEGSHTDFFRQITRNRAQRIVDRTWKTSREGMVRGTAGKQSEMNYIGRQQSIVAQWVALGPIFEVCAGETGYEESGRRREAWWRKDVTKKQLQETLAGVSQEVIRRRIQVESNTVGSRRR